MGTGNGNGKELTVVQPKGVAADLAVYAPRVKALIAEAKAITVVKTAEQAKAAGEIVTAIGEMSRAAEEKRKEWGAPFTAVVKGINAAFDATFAPADVEKRRLAGLVAAKSLADKQAAEAAAAAENARLAKQYEKDQKKAEAKGEDAPPPPPKVVASAPTSYGGAQVRTATVLIVVDASKIPARFLVDVNANLKAEDRAKGYRLTNASRVPLMELDAPAVLREYKAGRAVAGLKIEEQAGVAG
jgi:hypothetical protein